MECKQLKTGFSFLDKRKGVKKQLAANMETGSNLVFKHVNRINLEDFHDFIGVFINFIIDYIIPQIYNEMELPQICTKIILQG